jgi:hypothetical protein
LEAITKNGDQIDMEKLEFPGFFRTCHFTEALKKAASLFDIQSGLVLS